MDTNSKTVNAYIAYQAAVARPILKKLRALVKAAAPKAEESMSYGMPAYKLHGKPLVYFAAFKKHIGVYATPDGHSALKKELSKYKQGKGSVQFPLDQPIPYALIKKMVQYNAKSLTLRYGAKK